MSPQPGFDQSKQEAFVGKVLGDVSATFTTILASIGDHLGLFKDLSANGASTSEELATRTGIQQRYAREWLGGMVAAGYVEYDSPTRRFRLPPEHTAALAQESGPVFFGGIYQMIPAMIGIVDQLTEAFRHGGGVPQAAYHPSFWDGLERFTVGWFENLLLQQWIPGMPDVETKLKTELKSQTLAVVAAGRSSSSLRLFLLHGSSVTMYFLLPSSWHPPALRPRELPIG